MPTATEIRPTRWMPPGSLLRLLTGRRMLMPAERAKLAAALARIEDMFDLLRGDRSAFGGRR